MVAASSALERLTPALKPHDPGLADQLIRSVYELLKNAKAAMVAATVHSTLVEQTEMARRASEEQLRAAHALLTRVQSPRNGLATTSPRPLSPRSASPPPFSSPRSPLSLSPSPPPALSPRSPSQPLSPRISPMTPPQPLSLPLDLPLPASPRAASPLPSPQRRTPTSPTSAHQQQRVARPWEEEDRIISERAVEGVRKALHVLKLLSSADVRAHAREIAEVTREGLSDLTLVGNRAQAIGLELPAATLKASSAQLTQLIRQTLTSEYSEEEGERIAGDLALSVRAIMFSSYFASSLSPSSPHSQSRGGPVTEPRTVAIAEVEGKGKEKLGDEEVYDDGDGDRNHGRYDDRVAADQPVAMMHVEACAPPPESKMPEGKSLKESFRAYEFLLERRKPYFREDDADDDFKAKAEESGGRNRARSLYMAKSNVVDATKSPSEDTPNSDPTQENNGGELTASKQQHRLTINLGALAAQRAGNGQQDGGLRSSNSMPERGRPGAKDLQPASKSARGMASSPSSFKPPVTSASDERAVGKRLTIRKPVFLTGYLDATRFYIGGTISFRVIVNNMHKRPVKGVMMKLYKHTASFSYKHNKATGESERKVESRHKVKVATERATPAGFPVVQSKQWTGLVEFALPASLPPSIIADAAATYEIAYSAKVKLIPKSCAVELGPFELHDP